MQSYFRNIQRITEAQVSADIAQKRGESTDTRVLELERQVDKLTLTCQALWELLSKHADIDNEQFFQKINEIDLRDGVLNGKIDSSLIICSGCGRKINSTRPNCIYCGVFNNSELG